MTTESNTTALDAPLHLAARFGAFAIVTAGAIDMYVQGRDTARSWESHLAANVLQWLGVDQVRGSFKTYVLVAPRPGEMFAGNVTTACSAMLPLVVLAIATLGLIPGRPVHRLQRFVLGATLVIAFNTMRLVVVLFVGATKGMATMAPVHEWVGSFLTLTGWSITLMALFVLATRQRARTMVRRR
jgi:exosortase/archaeosortase family protein